MSASALLLGFDGGTSFGANGLGGDNYVQPINGSISPTAGGGCTIDSTTRWFSLRNGSLKILSANAAFLSLASSALTQVWLGFAYYRQTNSIIQVAQFNLSNKQNLVVSIDPQYRLSAYISDALGAINLGSAIIKHPRKITPGYWYRIEIRLQITTNSIAIHLIVNGDDRNTTTTMLDNYNIIVCNLGTSTGNTSHIVSGITIPDSPVWYDDIVYDPTGNVGGDCKVETLMASGDYWSGWGLNGAASHASAVSHLPFDGNIWVGSSNIYDTDWLYFTDLPSTAASILMTQAEMMVWSNAPGMTIYPLLNIDGIAAALCDSNGGSIGIVTTMTQSWKQYIMSSSTIVKWTTGNPIITPTPTGSGTGVNQAYFGYTLTT